MERGEQTYRMSDEAESTVEWIFAEIDALASSDWRHQPVGGPITYGFRDVLERLNELLAAFDSVVPRWHQMAYLRNYLSPASADLIRAAQELQAAQEHQMEQEIRAAARELEAEQLGRPLVFYGLSVPLPF